MSGSIPSDFSEALSERGMGVRGPRCNAWNAMGMDGNSENPAADTIMARSELYHQQQQQQQQQQRHSGLGTSGQMFGAMPSGREDGGGGGGSQVFGATTGRTAGGVGGGGGDAAFAAMSPMAQANGAGPFGGPPITHAAAAAAGSGSGSASLLSHGGHQDLADPGAASERMHSGLTSRERADYINWVAQNGPPVGAGATCMLTRTPDPHDLRVALDLSRPITRETSPPVRLDRAVVHAALERIRGGGKRGRLLHAAEMWHDRGLMDVQYITVEEAMNDTPIGVGLTAARAGAAKKYMRSNYISLNAEPAAIFIMPKVPMYSMGIDHPDRRIFDQDTYSAMYGSSLMRDLAVIKSFLLPMSVEEAINRCTEHEHEHSRTYIVPVTTPLWQLYAYDLTTRNAPLPLTTQGQYHMSVDEYERTLAKYREIHELLCATQTSLSEISFTVASLGTKPLNETFLERFPPNVAKVSSVSRKGGAASSGEMHRPQQAPWLDLSVVVSIRCFFASEYGYELTREEANQSGTGDPRVVALPAAVCKAKAGNPVLNTHAGMNYQDL